MFEVVIIAGKAAESRSDAQSSPRMDRMPQDVHYTDSYALVAILILYAELWLRTFVYFLVKLTQYFSVQLLDL